MPLDFEGLEEKMIEIGRICIKLAGRDAGREAAIIEILDNNYVLIDGNVRRRKCNIFHLEPTENKIDIKKGASHEEVKKEFEKLKINVWETKPKEKAERPRKQRNKKKLQAEAEPKKGKQPKTEKKEAEKKPKKETEKKEKPKSQKSKNSKEFLGHENPKDFHKPKVSEGLETKSQSKEKKPIDARVVSVTKKKEPAKKAEKKQ